jgi:hypothetical protein
MKHSVCYDCAKACTQCAKECQNVANALYILSQSFQNQHNDERNAAY